MPGYHLLSEGAPPSAEPVASFSRTINSPLRLGRQHLGADFHYVSREQCLVRCLIDGNVVVEACGKSKTGLKRNGEALWSWLAVGETATLQPGDHLALDRKLRPGSVLQLARHKEPSNSFSSPSSAAAALPPAPVFSSASAGPSSSTSHAAPSGLSSLSGDELAIILKACGSADNGWLIASALARTCTALNESVKQWRQHDATDLSFVGLGLDDEVLRRILACGCGNKLMTLNVARNTNVTDEAIVELLHGVPRLQRLALSMCQHVADRSLFALAQSHCAATLHHLDLSSCRFVTDAGAVAVARECRRLLFLSLSYDERALTDATLIQCGATLKRLETLELKTRLASGPNADRMTDEGFVELARGCTNLRKLDVSFCQGIRGDAIEALAQSCPDMRHLSLTSCRSIPPIHLHAVWRHSHKLEFLDLSSHLRLDVRALIAIVRECTRLEYLLIDAIKNLDEADWIGLAETTPPRLRCVSAVLTTGLTDESLPRFVSSCLELREMRLASACGNRKCPTCKVPTGKTSVRPSGNICTQPGLTFQGLAALKAAHPQVAITGGPQDPYPTASRGQKRDRM